MKLMNDKHRLVIKRVWGIKRSDFAFVSCNRTDCDSMGSTSEATTAAAADDEHYRAASWPIRG